MEPSALFKGALNIWVFQAGDLNNLRPFLFYAAFFNFSCRNFRFASRARTARSAFSRRCSGVSFAALARPPIA